MNDLDDLLAAAISCYRLVLQAYSELDASALQADGKVLAGLLEQMTPKLDAAREADLALMNYLDAAGSSYHHLPLMRAYRDLLGQVADRNQVLLGHARTHCAVVAAEMSELQTGKTIVAAYCLPSEEKGKTLRGEY